MKNIIICLPLVLLFGCAAIIGDNSNSSIALPLSILDAENLAREHLEDNNILWGEPTSTRQVQSKYIFSYFTPERESRLLGDRMLIVDMYTGEIRFPLRM